MGELIALIEEHGIALVISVIVIIYASATFKKTSDNNSNLFQMMLKERQEDRKHKDIELQESKRQTEEITKVVSENTSWLGLTSEHLENLEKQTQNATDKLDTLQSMTEKLDKLENMLDDVAPKTMVQEIKEEIEKVGVTLKKHVGE